MGLEPLLREVELTREQEELRTRFFELTGYGPSDVLALNYNTETFLTKNGGKYELSSEGIVHLGGPPPALEDRWEF